MHIRTTLSDDIPTLHTIMENLQVTSQNQRTGFYQYLKSEKQLLELLNLYFLVAESSRGIRGFNIAYDSKFAQGFRDKASYEFVFANFQESFVYIDSVGVSNPNSLSSGRIARMLLSETVDIAREQNIHSVAGYIIEKPWYNERSVKFALTAGFTRVADFEDSNTSFGLYSLSL